MPASLVKTKTPGIYKRGGKRRRFQGSEPASLETAGVGARLWR
jgi:hypothetical protein